jgi:[ribosomal protein S5]-alanine N-acetyltransferase
MNFTTIATKRLLLREMTPEVYRYVFNNYPDEELKYFFGLRNDEELGQKKQTWQNGLTMFNKSFLYFQLLKKDSGENIGWCGFHTWYVQHYRAEIGYTLTNETERRNGFMKEALPEIIRYGFEQMKLHRIEAFIGPGNAPSLKLVQNAGFVHEGHLREHYFKDGKIEDSVVFSLLKKEFNP